MKTKLFSNAFFCRIPKHELTFQRTCLNKLLMAGIVIISSMRIPEAYSASTIDPSKPWDIRMGETHFIPEINISEAYNDNIFFNDQFKKDSMVTRVRAGLAANLQRHVNHYGLSYALQSFNFHSSPEDDFVDHYVGANAYHEFSRKHRLDLNFGFVDGHYQRGTFFSQGAQLNAITSPDEFHKLSGFTLYRYGGANSRGNLELKARVDDYTFVNNRSQTKAWDRTDFEITPGFYLRIFQKTYAVLQIENNFVLYKNQAAQTASADYTKQRFLAGVTWRHSAKTEGTIRAGYLHQRFDSNSFDGVDGFTWDASARWRPQSYSTVDLSIIKDIEPSLGFGSVRLVEAYRAAWNHHWTPHIVTGIQGGYQHVNSRGIGRRDDIYDVQVGINYAFTPRFGIGLIYSYSKQDSTFNELDYAQNIVSLAITTAPLADRALSFPWQIMY